MEAQVRLLKDKTGNVILPATHGNAVIVGKRTLTSHLNEIYNSITWQDTSTMMAMAKAEKTVAKLYNPEDFITQ